MNRRTFLHIAAIAPVAALVACSESTTNGVTTITLNVAQVSAWGQAFVNAGTLLAPLTGPTGVAILSVVSAVENDISGISTLAGGNASLSFNSTSVPAAIQSLLSDGQTIISDAAGALGAGITTAAQTYLTAAQTIASLLAAAIGSVSVGVAAATPKMTENHALDVLGVKH